MQGTRQFVAAIAWAAVGLLCLYCLVAFLNLQKAMSAFIPLINPMSVALPNTTRLVLATWPWGYALLLVTACASAIIKEFLVRNKERSVVFTSTITIFVLLFVNWTTSALLAPLTTLINKIVK